MVEYNYAILIYMNNKIVLKIFSILISYFPLLGYALPCPNGNGIVYKGDSIAEVLKQCGEPYERKTEKIETLSQTEWVYYRPHIFDSGSSQIIFLLTNNRISRITITERYPYFFCQTALVNVGATFITRQTSCGDWIYNPVVTNLCGVPVGVNDDISRLTSICGAPISQKELQSDRREHTVFIYTAPDSQLFIFEDEKLRDFR